MTELHPRTQRTRPEVSHGFSTRQAANETKLVRKVVYAASSTYYGNQAVPFAETDPFMPTSPYAASKYMGELVMLTNDNLYKLPTLKPEVAERSERDFL